MKPKSEKPLKHHGRSSVCVLPFRAAPVESLLHMSLLFYRNWSGKDHRSLPIARDSSWLKDFLWPAVASDTADTPSCWPGLLSRRPWHWSSSGVFIKSSPHASTDVSLLLLTPWCWFYLDFGHLFLLILSLYMTFRRNVYSHDRKYHLHCDNFQIISPFWTWYPATSWTLHPTEYV